MSAITTRPMTTQDYDDVIAAIGSALRSTPPEITPPELAEDIANSYDHAAVAQRADGGDYFVAEVDSRIVGVIGLKNAELRTYFVHNDFQEQGVGRALYDTVETKARELGHDSIDVCASQYAKGIYEHYGFTITGEKHKERLGIPYFDYLMKKDLC